MFRIAEKLDFMNTKAVKVCQKVMTVGDMKQKKPYIYGILRKTVHGMEYS